MTRQKATAVIFEDIFGDRYAHLVEPKEIEGQRDFFIPPHITQGALTGDVVAIQIRNTSRIPETFMLINSLAKSGKDYSRYAVVDRIIEYSDNYCIGHFVNEGAAGCFVPDDKRIPKLPVFKTRRQNAVDGEKVLAKISRRKFAQEYKAGIVKTYGDSRLFEANYNAQLDAVYGDLGFSDSAVDDVRVFDTPPANDKKRRDLRSKPAITVEGFDGSPGIAYTVEAEGDGYVAYVHYADLDEYVSRGSDLDRVLYRRMRNLRMPHKSVAMLPSKLFNIVSFTAGQDKLAFTLILHFDKEGTCRKLDMTESVINVSVNGKYDELDTLVKHIDSSSTMSIREKYAGVYDMLKLMYRFGAVLMTKLDASGAFVGTDLVPTFVFDGLRPVDLLETKLCDIQLLRRYLYVAIGIAIAQHIGGEGFPLIYQGNPEPGLPILNRISEYWNSPVTNENLCPILHQLYDSSDAGISQRTQYISMYRAVAKTEMSTEPQWHHMYKVKAFALMPSPCTSYGGLSMIRIYKAYLNKDIALAKDIAEEAVWAYRMWNAYHITIEERLINLAMVAFVSHLPYPAEAVVSGISEDEIAITLASGGVGVIPLTEMEGAIYESETNTIFYHGNRIKFGSYITVNYERLNYNEGRSYFAPHR